MIDRSRIREGMVVFSSDGEKLGKVLASDSETFVIEKGFLFPKDYVASYEDVADVVGDDIRLSRTKEEFTREADMSGGRVGDSAMLAGGGSIGEMPSEQPVPASSEARVAAPGDTAFEQKSARQEPAEHAGSAPRHGTPPEPGTAGESGREPESKIAEERHNLENEATNAPREDPGAPGAGRHQ
jgi:hypothetical protein